MIKRTLCFSNPVNPAQLGRIFSFFDIVQDIVLVLFVYFVMSNISSNVFFLSKSQLLLFGHTHAVNVKYLF